MDTGESSKSIVKEKVKKDIIQENVPEGSGNKKGMQEQANELYKHWDKPVYKMNMDKIMEKIDLPFRKIKENLYLVAMSTKEEIEHAVGKIQTITKVTWSVKQTRKFDHQMKKPLTLFKRTYGCHMATRCRTKTKKIRNKKSRNIDCPAQLLVTVRRYTPHTKSKFRGPLLDEKYPCSLEFRNHHNHRIDAEDVLNSRPLGEEIKQTVLKLLNKGHSCASAYHTLYTIKTEEFGPDYKTKMADRHNFPKKNDISSIWKMHNFKEKTELNTDFSYTIRNLKDILNSYQKKNGTLYRLHVANQMIVLCICTPMMQRTLQQVSEILFIESSGDDIKEYKIYFILTQASVGALPIGCILSNIHSVSAFNDGMRLFFEMISIQPTVVLANSEIIKELIAQQFFPNSKILYSFYHILSSAWKVLHDTRHEIVRAKKESYYQLFREVVFADSEEGLVVARQVLAVECAQQKFLDYVDKMYEHITLWCLFYRMYIVLRGVDTFNYNEAEKSYRLFRLIAKVPLERTKLLNFTQITDYICSAFEKYYKGRVLEMVLNKESNVLLQRYVRTLNNVLHMEDIGHYQYIFKKATQEIFHEYYQVDMLTNLCTCTMGIMGKHCEHISEVLIRCNILKPLLTIEQKAAYYFVATGVLKHKNSFLPEQAYDLGQEYKVICCSPETILGPEYDPPNNPETEPVDASKAFSNLESTKSKWISYCNKVIQLMEKDPVRFLPAVNAHMDNIQKYSTSVPLLLKGLYAGFPYQGDAEKLPPLTIIRNKILTTNAKNKAPSLSTREASIIKDKYPPLLVHVKREPGVSSRVKESPVTTFRRKLPQNNPQKGRKKKKPPEEMCDSPWNNFSSESNSPMPNEEVEFSDEDSRDKNAILDEKDGILVEQQSEVDKDNTETFNSTLSLNQLSNNEFEDISRDEAEIYDIQKGIYVDQVALNQLTECEIAVLDEKKGILIIPMGPE